MQDKELRVLMTADAMGGVWTYAIELIKAWAPYNIQVALATMGNYPNKNHREQVANLPQVTLYESNFKLEWMDNPWADVEAAGEWLLQIAVEFKPDLIHLNNFCHGHLNWGVPVVMVVHSCVGSWFKAVKGNVAPTSWIDYHKAVALGLQAADLVVAPTQAMLQEAQNLYGPFNQSQVIYNGHHPGKFKVSIKEPLIFSVGRIWDEAKNIQMLTQISAELPWPVYIAGDARHPVSGKMQDLPNIHFLGTLPENEIIDYLSRAAIFVLPVKYEPFGLAILEAALSGCALVVGDIPSQREIWGAAATYVNPHNPEDLQVALRTLTENENIRNLLGVRARQRGQQFNIKQTASEYLNAYKALLGLTTPAKLKEKMLI